MLFKLKDIELKYPVQDLQCGEFKIWPIVRFYLAYQIQGNTNSFIESTKKNVRKHIFKQLFYGFKNIFRKYDYIIFSDSSERKKLNGLYVDKSVDYLANRLNKSLVFETPLPYHYFKDEIPTKYISTKLTLYVLTKIISFFIPVKLKNEKVLQEILNEANVELNYNRIIKNFISQYYVGKFLSYIYKPKAFIVQCSYTNSGYVKAFNDTQIKVIEVQHGLINQNHSAYNIYKQIDSSYYPKYLITYGNKEKAVFDNDNFFINPANVKPAGHYYLDSLLHNLVEDVNFSKLKSTYKRSVTISVQEIPVEEELIQFIKEAAAIDKDILFVYKTRFRKEQEYTSFQFPSNLIFVDWLNIYELILQTDFHITIFSTCAVEALSLGKANFLVNINNLSITHLSNVLEIGEFTTIVDTPEELVEKINYTSITDKEKIIQHNASAIQPNYMVNIKEAIDAILNET